MTTTLSPLELEEHFNRVCNSDDWRAPIDAWIPEKDFVATIEAVIHYTSTMLDIIDCNHSGMIRVVADGYRNGPAGP